MKVRFLCAALLLMNISMSFAGPKWVPLRSNDGWQCTGKGGGNVSYDKNSVKLLADGSVQIWMMLKVASPIPDSTVEVMREYATIEAVSDSLLIAIRAALAHHDSLLARWREACTPEFVYGTERENYGKLDETLTLCRFDCTRDRMAIVQGVSYTEDGTPFDTFQPDSIKWSIMVPGSVGECWLEAACNIKRSRATK